MATHAITGHQVALKLINRSKITTPDMNARVKREIQYLKVLRHPHIIKLYVVHRDVTRLRVRQRDITADFMPFSPYRYEVITTPTDVIMVMEYAGEELFNYIVAKGKHGVSDKRSIPSFTPDADGLRFISRCPKMRLDASSSR